MFYRAGTITGRTTGATGMALGTTSVGRAGGSTMVTLSDLGVVTVPDLRETIEGTGDPFVELP